MEKRELYREFQLAGRKWRVGKWDARTGSYWAHKFMTETPPQSIRKGLANVGVFGSQAMNKADFFDLENDCLALVDEHLDAGWTPILNADGNFAVVGLEKEGGLVLLFVIQAMDFNLRSFFPEGGLASLASPLDTSQPVP